MLSTFCNSQGGSFKVNVDGTNHVQLIPENLNTREKYTFPL